MGCWRFCLSFFRELPRNVSLPFATHSISVTHPPTTEMEVHNEIYQPEGALVEVTEEVFAVIQASDRAEDAYKRRMYRYKAQYSLDCNNGIEKVVMVQPPTPEEILEDKQLREQLYAAVMALPDKQAKRIYAHFYLGMTPKEIAQAEGVDPGRVRDSIRKGLRKLAKQF